MSIYQTPYELPLSSSSLHTPPTGLNMLYPSVAAASKSSEHDAGGSGLCLRCLIGDTVRAILSMIKRTTSGLAIVPVQERHDGS